MNASMTRKHFEALAAELKRVGPAYWIDATSRDTVHMAAIQAVADVCARFNPNFDRARFLAACGVEGGN